MAPSLVGSRVKRREDPRLIMGRGTYVDDVQLPRMTYAAILRSPYAHAKITNIDRASRRVVLSVKARELNEEKKAMADFGSSDSGASLGDILGAALSRAQKKEEEDQ